MAGAVIDRGELVVLAPPPRPSLPAGRITGWRAGRVAGCGGGEGFDKLDVDLHPMPGLLLFVPLPAAIPPLIALRGRQPVEAQTFEDAPHTRAANRDIMVPLRIHADLPRAEVIVLSKMQNLLHDLGVRGMRQVLGRRDRSASPPLPRYGNGANHV